MSTDHYHPGACDPAGGCNPDHAPPGQLPTRIARLEALKLLEKLGAPIDERTLDRYRDRQLLTTHRPPDKPFVVELDRAEVERLAAAIRTVDTEPPLEATRRVTRIRDLMAAAEAAETPAQVSAQT